MATPSGGLHLYFAVPAGLTITSVTGAWPGIDTRGPGRRSGGNLIGPGSVVGGRAYVIARDAPIASLPGWLAGALARQRGPGGNTRRTAPEPSR